MKRNVVASDGYRWWERLGAVIVTASLLVVGLGFLALGLTFLPIIGLFVGLACFWLARGLWTGSRQEDFLVPAGAAVGSGEFGRCSGVINLDEAA
jgi:hypothetical protein